MVCCELESRVIVIVLAAGVFLLNAEMWLCVDCGPPAAASGSEQVIVPQQKQYRNRPPYNISYSIHCWASNSPPLFARPRSRLPPRLTDNQRRPTVPASSSLQPPPPPPPQPAPTRPLTFYSSSAPPTFSSPCAAFGACAGSFSSSVAGALRCTGPLPRPPPPPPAATTPRWAARCTGTAVTRAGGQPGTSSHGGWWRRGRPRRQRAGRARRGAAPVGRSGGGRAASGSRAGQTFGGVCVARTGPKQAQGKQLEKNERLKPFTNFA